MAGCLKNDGCTGVVNQAFSFDTVTNFIKKNKDEIDILYKPSHNFIHYVNALDC